MRKRKRKKKPFFMELRAVIDGRPDPDPYEPSNVGEGTIRFKDGSYAGEFKVSPWPENVMGTIEQLIARSDITVFTVAPGSGNVFRGWARLVTDHEYGRVSNTT